MAHKVLQTRHVLAVNDLSVSAPYYVEKLGFQRDFTVDGWEFLSLDGFRVMLGECRDEVPAAQTNNHSYFAHVLVEDVDALCAEVKSRGAQLVFDVRDQPWGLREFGVVTPDGHRICFAQDIETEH